MVQSDVRIADPRASAAARRMQAQIETTAAETQGSAALVDAVMNPRAWTSELILVRPETVIRWRKGKFREFWSRMSSGRLGRPPIPGEHIDFIRQISSNHPEYGKDRIALELEVKFGIRHACSTIRRYMVKKRA